MDMQTVYGCFYVMALYIMLLQVTNCQGRIIPVLNAIKEILILT